MFTIAAENQRSGTFEWYINETVGVFDGDWDTGLKSSVIEGFCSHASVMIGDRLQIFINTAPASEVDFTVYRMGFYQGKGGRKIISGTISVDRATQTEVVPPSGDRRIRRCNWRPSAELYIAPPNGDEDNTVDQPMWPSGVYVIKLTSKTAARMPLPQYSLIFVVRDNRKCDFLFQCSDLSWQAYNQWPSSSSLYDSEDKNGVLDHNYFGTDVEVSFWRPYAIWRDETYSTRMPGAVVFHQFEFPMLFWMEEQGYDVSYTSGLDTHRDGVEGLSRTRVWLSVGHDEYWSLEMYRALEGAVKDGVSLGFFGGGTGVTAIAISDNDVRYPDVSFRRIAWFSTVDSKVHGGTLPDLSIENHLMGAQYILPGLGYGPWVCQSGDAIPQWFYAAGTDQRTINNLVGFEFTGKLAQIDGLAVVATSPTCQTPSKSPLQPYYATIYSGPKGNYVFNASTMWWSRWLSAPQGCESLTYKGASIIDPQHGGEETAKDIDWVRSLTKRIFQNMLSNERSSD